MPVDMVVRWSISQSLHRNTNASLCKVHMSGHWHTSEKLWVYDSIIQYVSIYVSPCVNWCRTHVCQYIRPHCSPMVLRSTWEVPEKYLRSTWEVSECQKLFGDSSDSVFPTSDPKCLLFVEGSNRFGDEGLSMFKIFTCTSCTNCKAATKLPQNCHKPDTHREMTREIMWTKEKMGKIMKIPFKCANMCNTSSMMC